MKKVAIFQNTITGGGRIRVLNEIIQAINKLGIAPDVYAYKINAALAGNLKIRKLVPFIYGLYEAKILSLNLRMKAIAGKYDLCINSNNTILFAPDCNSVSYIHFPREARIQSIYEKSDIEKSQRNLFNRILTGLAKRRKYNPLNKIIANSGYTKEIITRVYPEIPASEISVIYPPYYPTRQTIAGEKRDVVCTLGRFAPDKNQLEQIQIAEKLPELNFEIMGFAADRNSRNYFKKCKYYIADNKTANVTLLPNLTSEEVAGRLGAAKFFMHNLRHEPFGISTVEAIAFGCIPIVHNSGGQCEIVPLKELRFNSTAEAIDILRNQHGLENSVIQSKLQANIKRFEAGNFSKKMASILRDKLN